MYRVIASEIGAVGYNTLLAPCVDVNSNPENPIIGMRSFGGRTADVARHAAAAVLGAREGGALTTAKHFPGHGNTLTDSHRGLPRVERSRKEIDEIDLPPFRAAVAAGVDIVMTSHILYPAVDPKNPATLSFAILRELLRKEMGFDGVILSDSMNMGAIRKNYRPEEAATSALRSGVDMIMLAEEHYDHDAERYVANQVAMIESIARMARNEESAMLRLDEAVLRILAARRRASERSNAHTAAGMDGSAARGGTGAANSADDRDGAVVGSAAHRAVERKAAERAVWLVQNRRGLLPLGKDATIAIVPLSPRSAYSILTQTRGIGPNQGVPAADAFIQATRASHAKTHVQPVESLLEAGRPDAGTAKADVVIAVIEEYPLPGVSFDKSAVEPGLSHLKPVADRMILVGLCDPYLASRYAERAGACICTSSSRECAAVAAARALIGAFTPGGGSPMRLFS
jgi:beta-N-acetylhexosaminidase